MMVYRFAVRFPFEIYKSGREKLEIRKEKFIEYLQMNASRFSIFPIHPGIRAVLKQVFHTLPAHLSDNDWQMLALMIDGYDLSTQLGMGNLGDYFTKQYVPQYLESGILQDKSKNYEFFWNATKRKME